MIIKTKQQGAEHLVRGIPHLFNHLEFVALKIEKNDDEATYVGYRKVRNPIFFASDEGERPRLELAIYRDMHDVNANDDREDIARKIENSSLDIPTTERRKIMSVLNASSLDGLLFNAVLIIPPFRGSPEILQLKEIIEGGCKKYNVYYSPFIYPDTTRYGRKDSTFLSFPDKSEVVGNVVIRNEQEAEAYIRTVKKLVGSIVRGIEQRKS